MNYSILSLLIFFIVGCYGQSLGQRKQINLNGEWQITKSESFERIPTEYKSKVHVPGLVDLASPALDTNRLYNNGVYWYKTNFTINRKYPELVQLEIGKVKYHAKVYLNNKLVGEQLYCFTSGVFDIRKFLNPKGKNNELVIGVGTANNMPDTVIWGFDQEKLTYIPGIYDNVRLTLSGFPFISNIQIAPLVKEEKVRVVAKLDEGQKGEKTSMSYVIRELKNKQIVAEGKSLTADFTIPMTGCKLWSPESPFLYELELSTVADKKTVRFGMRSFSFDKQTGHAMLNGKPYFMRGTNVCIFRFFEDPDRGLLPWNNDWVIRLHQQFKDMHWNSMRYCIGPPPERWYEIADSLGFLIQNEYPIWTSVKNTIKVYPGISGKYIANEFRVWMSDHWNHPSVVIWDAQNESVTKFTGEAIKMVRGLDLSNRPWENGWSAPDTESDPYESHPYLFMKYRSGEIPSRQGPLADNLQMANIPDNGVNVQDPPKDKSRYTNPIIINEYEWLWLNRDGSTTTMTDKVYDVVFGKDLTKEQRIYLSTRYIGMITEYWRAHRMCAGVLHFCGLGYSRPIAPRGQTSDNFIDIKNLIFEPQYVKYVKPSFAPVGLMINFWDKYVSQNFKKNIDIYTINDLDINWSGPITLTIFKGDKVISKNVKEITVPALGRIITNFPIAMNEEKGDYRLEAEISLNGEQVKSIREFTVE